MRNYNTIYRVVKYDSHEQENSMLRFLIGWVLMLVPLLVVLGLSEYTAPGFLLFFLEGFIAPLSIVGLVYIGAYLISTSKGE